MLDDLKKFATSTLLFSLDRIIGPRLFTLAYLAGLATIVLLAMNHLVFSFSFGFGNGIWGLLEIAVMAPLAVLVLRIVCEAGILFFKNNQETSDKFNRDDGLQSAPNLIEDVREAIEELANQDQETTPTPKAAKEKPASKLSNAKTGAGHARKTPAARKTPGRTARRKPATPATPGKS